MSVDIGTALNMSIDPDDIDDYDIDDCAEIGPCPACDGYSMEQLYGKA